MMKFLRKRGGGGVSSGAEITGFPLDLLRQEDSERPVGVFDGGAGQRVEVCEKDADCGGQERGGSFESVFFEGADFEWDREFVSTGGDRGAFQCRLRPGKGADPGDGLEREQHPEASGEEEDRVLGEDPLREEAEEAPAEDELQQERFSERQRQAGQDPEEVRGRLGRVHQDRRRRAAGAAAVPNEEPRDVAEHHLQVQLRDWQLLFVCVLALRQHDSRGGPDQQLDGAGPAPGVYFELELDSEPEPDGLSRKELRDRAGLVEPGPVGVQLPAPGELVHGEHRRTKGGQLGGADQADVDINAQEVRLRLLFRGRVRLQKTGEECASEQQFLGN
ncbi:hypothetical protein OJ252_3699 [Cryptosporidium canis]|uniref:Uncharacterized protein n=1 Tax=Cryptosporidium canis TaxID=195482 RepID=A0ABQ8P1J1_9CRYT|nr:hypothetical protein OJ252_3699 [Cryptosporidium canis]